jgi:hypothetical protein
VGAGSESDGHAAPHRVRLGELAALRRRPAGGHAGRPRGPPGGVASARVRSRGRGASYRVADRWQFTLDADLEKQDLDNDLRDNDFGALGFAVRWRGSRLFSPEIGVRGGTREVNDDAQTYDQRESFLQIRSQPVPRLYLSVRFRKRTRDYENVAREDERRQVTIGADYTISERLVLNLYAAGEEVDSSLPGRDFDTGYAIAGLTWKF